MKAGKAGNKAVLRTLANKDALNFTTRRLLKDLAEIQNNQIPTVGVSAAPLEENLFVWHGNLKGPEGTQYEGGVFHISLKIPETYPRDPPTVEILGVDLPHPNIFGPTICLDMLTPSRAEESSGWSSGYTILSILIQLQSFLFEKFYDNTDHKQQIRRAVENANQYKCTTKSCKHGGKLAAWPAFNSKETQKEAFKICESEKSLFEKDLICYHTKLTHKEKPLGIGLLISRIPRSGLIKQSSPCLDYVSLKAFIKEGVRLSSTNEKFTHWLPLFFGEEKDRTLHLGRKAISMICASHTKRFKEEMVLDVFPKTLITLVFQMMDEKRHCSIRILRILAHVYCLYLLFIESYPNLLGDIEKQIDEFVKDANKRIKDHTPNMGAFMSSILVAFKTNHQDVLNVGVEEQMDRQVMWMLKSIPELEDPDMQNHIDANRAQIVFKHESTSYHITLFYKMFADFLRENFKDTKEALTLLSDNFGRFPDKMEDEIQRRVFKILEVDSYAKFFEYLGQGKIDDATLNQRLKQAVVNSRRKKYHGTDDEIHTLPTSEEQLNQLQEEVPKFQDFVDKESKNLVSQSEDKWKEACQKRWMWIKEVCENTVEIKPLNLAEMSDARMQAIEFTIEEELVSLKNQYLKDFNKTDSAPTLINRYSQTLSWCQLFLKLDLEDHLIHMDQNPDFPLYYNKLKIVNNYIDSLVVPVQYVKNVKSGHFYLTALLTHLTKLKHLEIIGLNGRSQQVNLSALKAIAKGFNNFLANGGNLKEISYGPFTASSADKQSEMADKLFSPLAGLQELAKIAIYGNNMMSFQGGKALSKIVTDHKNIIELNISNCNLTKEIAKDLADGLMRAKQLQRIDIRNNSSISQSGLASIIYNLAFSPKLTSLNISDTQMSGAHNEVVEALYKLLRISASLEVLLAKNFTNLNAYLTKDFFVALGEVHSLRILDISNSGAIGSGCADMLGKAIAFNAFKKGKLEVINLDEGVINSINILNTIYNNMQVSNYDHEAWYGDVNKLGKMEGNDHKKVYYNNLKALQLKGNSLTTAFNYLAWKKQFNPVDPNFVKLLARSAHLESVQLSSCKLQKNDADILLLALDPARAGYCSNIKILNLARNNLGKDGVKILSEICEKNQTIEVLDLSGNKFGVAGAQMLAKALKTNKTIKYLNLFNNLIDVDGARAFESTLKSNTTLEFLDLGSNRLRDEGLFAIARGLAANPASGIKYLGLRFNFITEDGITGLLKKLFSAGTYNGKLHSLFIKNNSINEFGLFNIVKVVNNLNVKLHFDLFDKMKRLEPKILERTIWIHPATVGTANDVKNFFETTQKTGIVLDVRKRKGPKWANRMTASNEFYFVEFAHPVSVSRALLVASKRQAVINGTTFRIFKAGSGNYFYSKQKKIKKSQTNILNRKPKRPTRFSSVARGRGARRGVVRGRRG